MCREVSHSDSGAFYVTQVSPSSATYANISGTASLAGTVLATFATGGYVTKDYLILQSAGLNGTTFGALIHSVCRRALSRVWITRTPTMCIWTCRPG